MRAVCLIPARLASSRLPQKLLQTIGQKSIIEHTYLNALKFNIFHKVAVVTDSIKIQKVIEDIGGEVIYKPLNYECGTDRVADVVDLFDGEIIFNIQGDEPFLSKSCIMDMLNEFKDDSNDDIDIVSSMALFEDKREIENPNNVKVVTDIYSNALYFSRSVIPYQRGKTGFNAFYKHQGVYGFRKATLQDLKDRQRSPLENEEKIEAIGFLEIGMKIRMVINNTNTIGIDTPEDLIRAREFYQKINKGLS